MDIEKRSFGKKKLSKEERAERRAERAWETISEWKDFVLPEFTREEFFEERLYSRRKGSLKWKCQRCGQTFTQSSFRTSGSKVDFCDRIPKCPKCWPKYSNASLHEVQLLDWIQLFCPDAHKDRELISPKELDIVVPSKKVAIEYNGIWWHSSKKLKSKKVHQLKSDMCRSRGYSLFHVFEHEWRSEQELVKRKLKMALGIVDPAEAPASYTTAVDGSKIRLLDSSRS